MKQASIKRVIEIGTSKLAELSLEGPPQLQGELSFEIYRGSKNNLYKQMCFICGEDFKRGNEVLKGREPTKKVYSYAHVDCFIGAVFLRLADVLEEGEELKSETRQTVRSE